MRPTAHATQNRTERGLDKRMMTRAFDGLDLNRRLFPQELKAVLDQITVETQTDENEPRQNGAHTHQFASDEENCSAKTMKRNVKKKRQNEPNTGAGGTVFAKINLKLGETQCTRRHGESS
jgi:hypothetical protein